jgi:hypothetical protein
MKMNLRWALLFDEHVERLAAFVRTGGPLLGGDGWA